MATSSTIKRVFTGAVAALMLAVAAVPVSAQDIDAEQLETFEDHVATASDYVEAGDYEAGIEELRQAREIIDHPRVSETIADAYRDWGRCSRAEQQYRSLLERDDLEEDRRQQIETSLEDLSSDCVEMAVLRVECTPEAAQLELDGQQVACPFEDDVPVGEVEIRATAEGYQRLAETVEVASEQTNRFDAQLLPVDDGPDWIQISSWAAIGVGAGLLAGGGVNDYFAGDRTTELARARQDDDFRRIEQLEESAANARILTIVLYASGLVVTGAGVAAQFVDVEEVLFEEEEPPGFSLRVGPTDVAAVVRW